VFAHNWLSGTLCDPKRPFFRHTLQIFLIRGTACKNPLRLTKNAIFLYQRRPPNQLHFRYKEQNIINFKDTTKHLIAALKKLFC
jgi:hypothetical protein